ncbi:MAG: hypothetical protein HYT28_01115 [Parcubacteria group bacterium]|nr:hypothetical protein [Parcubacteria group bacterium]
MENADTTQNHSAAEPEKPIGPAIGAIIIVLVLIIGAFYFWGSKLEKTLPVDENATAEEVLAVPDTSLQSIQTQGNSDEIDAIEQDVNATDLQNLNSELNNIDAELAL